MIAINRLGPNLYPDYSQAAAHMYRKALRREARSAHRSDSRQGPLKADLHLLNHDSNGIPVVHSPTQATNSQIAALANQNGIDFHHRPITEFDLELYFADPRSRNRILKGIDLIWRKEYLFNKGDASHDSYIDYLKNIASLNTEYFSRTSSEGYSNINFSSEFTKLADNQTLDDLTKRICLTQALELALMGVYITPVIQNINKHSGPSRSEDGSHGDRQPAVDPRNDRPNDFERTKGYRQELLAGWFMAKFIYPGIAEYEDPYPIQHAIKMKNDKSSTSRKKKEIDIMTPNAIVEVKHHATLTENTNQFADELESLFKFVLNSNASIGLRDRIRHLVVISGSDHEADWSVDNDTSEITQAALHKINQRKGLASLDEKYQLGFKTGKNQVEIYQIAPAKNYLLVRNWIRLLYDEYADNLRSVA